MRAATLETPSMDRKRHAQKTLLAELGKDDYGRKIHERAASILRSVGKPARRPAPRRGACVSVSQ